MSHGRPRNGGRAVRDGDTRLPIHQPLLVVASKEVDWSNLPRHQLAKKPEVPPRHSANVIDYKITDAVGRDLAAQSRDACGLAALMGRPLRSADARPLPHTQSGTMQVR